jgi:hypothetical protein
LKYLISSIILMCMAAATAHAQCADKTDFGGWLNCKIAAQIAVKNNGLNVSKQQEVPTVSPQSTSLVDQSSASDFFNLAMNLAQASGGADSTNNTNSVTVTTSAYALYAAANRHDPFDPDFYARKRNWRRAYLTLGRDIPNSTSATKDPHLQQPGTIGGLKLSLYDKRDISHPANQPQFGEAAKALGQSARAYANIMADVSAKIPGILARTSFKDLTDAQNQEINQIIDRNMKAFEALNSALQRAVDNIRSQAQWAFSYQGDFRNSQGYNLHKAGTQFALGPNPWVNFTLNANYQRWDGKKFGPDRQGGDLAAEFDYRITEDTTVAQPYLLSLSVQSEWLTKQKPVYKAQLKLTIPLGQKTGLSFPASVTYASRSDLIQEARVEGRFGFTFDVAKVFAALSKH